MGLNSSDCSHSLQLDFFRSVAASFLMEFDLFNGRAFSADFGLECDRGFYGAIDVFKLLFLQSNGSVYCGAIDDGELENGNCDAITLFFSCKI